MVKNMVSRSKKRYILRLWEYFSQIKIICERLIEERVFTVGKGEGINTIGKSKRDNQSIHVQLDRRCKEKAGEGCAFRTGHGFAVSSDGFCVGRNRKEAGNLCGTRNLKRHFAVTAPAVEPGVYSIVGSISLLCPEEGIPEDGTAST